MSFLIYNCDLFPSSPGVFESYKIMKKNPDYPNIFDEHYGTFDKLSCDRILKILKKKILPYYEV